MRAGLLEKMPLFQVLDLLGCLPVNEMKTKRVRHLVAHTAPDLPYFLQGVAFQGASGFPFLPTFNRRKAAFGLTFGQQELTFCPAKNLSQYVRITEIQQEALYVFQGEA